MFHYRIAAAHADHLYALPSIECAAGELLAAYASAEALAGTTSLEEFSVAQAAGRLWVALDDETPAGFALVTMLDPHAPHLAEMDVSPTHMRQGIGAALLETVLQWARAVTHPAVTLTTFRDAPWNAPFYARHGFTEVHAAAWSPELRALVELEDARGLDRASRVVMECRVSAG